MRLTLHFHHLLVFLVQDPDVVRVGGVGAARRRRPLDLYCAEGGRGGHDGDRIESFWEKNGNITRHFWTRNVVGAIQGKI